MYFIFALFFAWIVAFSCSVHVVSNLTFINVRTISYVFSSQNDITTGPVWFQLLADGANQHRRTSMVSLSMKLILPEGACSSPDDIAHLCLYDGKDNQKDLKKFAADIFPKLQAVVSSSQFEGLDVTFFVGGDLAFLHEFCGLSGCACNFPCLWCPVKSSDLHKLDTLQMRDTAKMKTMSHKPVEGEEFCCHTCQKPVRWTSAAVTEAQASAAFKKDRDEHRASLEGQQLFNAPLLDDVCIDQIVPCSLHALLRIAAHCFVGSVVRFVTTADIAEKINAQLVKDNIKITPLKPQSSKGKDTNDPPTLQGAYCWQLLETIEEYVDIVAPCDNAQQRQQRLRHLDMWHALANVFDFLCGLPLDFDLNPGVQDTPENAAARSKLAAKAKELAITFLNEYSRALTSKAVTVYHHILVHHIPEVFERFGSIERFSGQALERSHQVRKKDGRD